MKRFALNSKVALSALLLASQAGAADAGSGGTFDWSGFYLGGLIGGSGTSSDGDVNYTNDGATPPVGWTDGEFHGDVYNAVDSLAVSTDFGGATNTPMPNLTDWPTSFSSDSSDAVGTALAGFNFQNGNLVFGGELRASFGDFGASHSDSWSESGTTSGSVAFDFEGTNDFTYTNYNGVLTGIISPITNTEGAISYTATYNQDANIDFGTQFNYLISPVARLGFAVDRVQLFAMGGPAFANIKATTSATIDEYVTSASTTVDSTNTNFSGDETYEFSGSNSKKMWGFTIGGGAEWAITDNVILRVEGEYHDLGTVSVTGTSLDTDATYTVKQKLDGYSASTGVSFKF